MFKLLKYEFRKGLTAMLVMLGVTAALEAYFLYGLYSGPENEVHAALAAMLLVFMTFAMYVFVLIRGVTSYSGELKSRSSYLIFMTPNSTRKIMASKFLYPLVLGTGLALLYIALGVLDFSLLLGYLGEWEDFLNELQVFLKEMGVHADQIIFGAVFAVIYMLLSVLSFFAVAFLAVTLSHTFFRDKSWRWLMALVFYIGINYAIGAVNGLFPAVYSSLHVMDAPGVANITAAYGIDTTPEFSELLIYVLPQALVSLAVILISFFGCSWMLEKKISL
ncbi:MAG: hypothetical protein IJ343_00420 [Clostridia bacterium]|nr:hypothetical protein [Clostridia bacterium]